MCLPCPVCFSQKFDNTESLRMSLIKAANGPIVCPLCSETFIGLDKFTIHLFSHCDVAAAPSTGTSSPILPTDNRILNETEDLTVNLNDNLATCQQCDLIAPEKCSLHSPGRSNTDTTSNGKYLCKLCSKTFNIRGSLKVHMKVVHAVDLPNQTASTNEEPSKMWECDICHKMFTTKYFLKKHKRLHTGETPYNCEQCGKTFTFQQSYHKHLLYHSDDKPYVCQICGRAFKELSTLHNHERIHSGEKPFECETCGKCFRQRVSYLVHKRIHTGVMPYKCTACEKSFRYKVSLRNHKCILSNGETTNSFEEIPESTKKDDDFDVDEFIAQSCDKMGILENDQTELQFPTIDCPDIFKL